MSYQFKAFAGLTEGTSPPAPRIIIPGPCEHYALPEGVTKTGAIHFTCQALTLIGVTRSAVQAYRLIADTSDAAAWSSMTSAPVNWRQAQNMAAELGVSPRHWRRLESELEHAGAIARVTAENGFRGQKCRGAIAFGLSLEPTLANLTAYMAIIDKAAQQKQAAEIVIAKIRATRHRLRKRLEFYPNADASAAIARIDADRSTAPPISAGRPPCPAMSAYLENLTAMEASLIAQNRAHALSQSEQCSAQSDAQIEPKTAQKSQTNAKKATALKLHINSEKMSGGLPKMSGAPDTNVRCHYNLDIQKQTLNADFDFEENRRPKEPHRHNWNTSTSETATGASVPKTAAPQTKEAGLEQEVQSGSVALHRKSAACDAGSAKSALSAGRGAGIASNPTENGQHAAIKATDTRSGHLGNFGPGTNKLTPASLLDLRTIDRVFSFADLLTDIQAERAGTPCAGLDPQHIWDRFRRYNLKRDKQIIPLAALRAFMRGWIPDGQGACVANTNKTKKNKTEAIRNQPSGQAAQTAAVSGAAANAGQGGGTASTTHHPNHPDIQAWWAKASWDNRHFDERDLRRKLGTEAYDAQIIDIQHKYGVGHMVAQIALHGREIG